MSDAADIYGHPVADADKARESFMESGSNTDKRACPLRGVLETRVEMDIHQLQGRGTQYDCIACSLSNGHPGDHCGSHPSRGRALFYWNDQGVILREL
ncbi:MAG: hypothetical protein ACJ71S_06090 [Acidobacteriaceae bacterium]